MEIERLTMTIEQTAAALGVSRGTAYEAVKVGTIPTLRLGRRLLVPVAALRKMLEERTAPHSENADVQPLARRAS